MDKIRSWDGMSGDVHFVFPTFKDTPVRVVAWPEGAPKQEDVPHAGEKLEYLPQSRICTVVNGIPVGDRTSDYWSMRVVDEKGIIFYANPLKLAKVITSTQTYTEDEIRRAMDYTRPTHIDLYKNEVMERLREKNKS